MSQKSRLRTQGDVNYVVYRFEDGSRIERVLRHEAFQHNPNMIQCLFLVTTRDQRDTLIFRESLEELNVGLQGISLGSYRQRPTASMASSLIPFFEAMGIERPYFQGSLPDVIEVDDDFHSALHRFDQQQAVEDLQQRRRAEEEHQGLMMGQKDVEALHDALSGLMNMRSSVIKIATWESKRPGLLLIMDDHHSVRITRYIEGFHNDRGVAPLYDSYWRISLFPRNNNLSPGFESNRKEISKSMQALEHAWGSVESELERSENLHVQMTSALGTFWAYRRREGGQPTFDPTMFRLLNVRCPVLASDEVFVAWAEAIGLERGDP